MTPTRSWLALGALLAAVVAGTVWAEQKKPVTPALPPDLATNPQCPAATDKKCCDEKCCTKDEAKSCCEDKCRTAEKAKSCCADGKCCGCCEKGKETRVISVPVVPGAGIQVTVEPLPGAQAAYNGAYEMPFAAPPPPPYVSTPYPPLRYSDWAGSCTAPPCPQPATPPLGCLTTQNVPAPCAVPQQPVGLPAPSAMTTPVTQYAGAPCVAPPPPALPPQAAEYRPISGVNTATGTSCTILAPLPAQPWQLRVVELNHHPRLMMQWECDRDTRVSCEEMTVHVGPEPLTVSVEGKQVHVSGNFVKGSADTITRNTADGSLLLEGHVKMHYGKEGKKVEVAADEVVVGFADGRVEVRGLGRAAWPAAQPAPKEKRPTPTTTPTSCPACPASGTDCQQLFNFWTGFFQ